VNEIFRWETCFVFSRISQLWQASESSLPFLKGVVTFKTSVVSVRKLLQQMWMDLGRKVRKFTRCACQSWDGINPDKYTLREKCLGNSSDWFLSNWNSWNTSGVWKVHGLTLLLRVGTLWRCGDGLFFEVPPLASDALLTTPHPLLENVLQTVCRKLHKDSGTGGFDLSRSFLRF
jgi:hypothetical protein